MRIETTLVADRLAAPRIAVLLPCRDEAAAIAQTVEGFRAALPEAAIYVYDNASTDRTAEVAEAAGAVVRREPRPGKGNVMRRMFADVDADIYVLADGDATYDASCAPALVERLREGRLDMVCGARVHTDPAAERRGHRFGNRLLTGLAARIFERGFEDMLTGYRVFSRRFVKTFPAASMGFEVETELTVHALQLRLPCDEMATPYGARPEGCASKLSTIRDAVRIVRTIGLLAKEERPMAVFGLAALALAAPSLALFASVLAEYMATGLVPRLPTLVVSMAGMGLAALSGVCALVLDTVARGRREARYLAYLAHPALP